tara:strand:- start:86 stop:1750 length:1665 start_codon:yes stop_codon:yes gene_type:complete
MEKKKICFFILLIFLSKTIWSQNNPSPIDIPLKISGNFGELRNTHFHTGIDIKTNGKEGLKVRIVKNGYLSRVRINKGGYGKSLYMSHPDGTTSVYAHLNKFSKIIEDYVKKIQYENQSYEIQNFPEPNQFMFNSGDLIGYSGNTGSSSGPHLHFEMRNSKTLKPFNPINIGLKIIDTIEPIIKGLYLYEVYDDGDYKLLKKIPIKKINNTNYIASTIYNIGKLGIGLNFFDRQDNSYSKNGVYSINFKINDKSIFHYKMDEINFNDKKYLKLLVDYKNWYLKKNKIQKLFTHPKSKYSFIDKSNSTGILKVSKNDQFDGIIEIEDFNRNKINVILKIDGILKDSMSNVSNKEIINPNYEYQFKSNGVSVLFPKNSFYNSVYFKIKNNNDTLDLGENIYPLNKSFEIKYEINKNDSLFIKKGFISKINKYGNPIFLNTLKKNNLWSVKVSELGQYALSIDTISPKIKPLNFKKNQSIKNLKILKLKVNDDLSGVKSIKGFINKKWVLFEHEPKKKLISHNLSDLNFKSKKLELKITVEDYNKNISEFETILNNN